MTNSIPADGGDVASLYQAPQSDINPAVGDDLLTAFVGPENTDYYVERFARLDGNGPPVYWHWPAFFVTTAWLLYRKMWLWALVYSLVVPMVMVGLLAGLALAVGPEVADIIYTVVYGIFSFVVVPILANRLYYEHAKKKVAAITAGGGSESEQQELARKKGGTSWWWLIVFVPALLGIIAAISIPAYQDYVQRAQAFEAQSLESQ